ncbi:MAG: prepilin-type N-terminal cleavage/methylation domain-containing protein [Candidatus Spechtbacterales bacterium]
MNRVHQLKSRKSTRHARGAVFGLGNIKLKANSSKLTAHQGFTLVELIVYIGILGIILVFLSQFLVSTLRANSQGKAREAVITNAVQAVNAIDFEIRNAEDIYLPTSQFGEDGQVSLVTNTDFLEKGTSGFADIFISEDGRLCIKRDPIGTSCVTSSEVVVTDISFTLIHPGTSQRAGIQTNITVEYDTQSEAFKLPFTLQTSSHVRSYE